MRSFIAALCVLAALAARGAAAAPPGPADFRPSQPILAASYFYWYDQMRGEHWRFENGADQLTDHPVKPVGYSYRRPEWHREQLEEIMAAGIDVILPVYWGTPVDTGEGPFAFSRAGIPPLIRAANEIRATGRRPPGIGLFYDTSTLQTNPAGVRQDLSTPAGRAWFGDTIIGFFRSVPRALWATIADRPIVFLYAANYAAGGTDDPRVITETVTRFDAAFGVRPYIVREVSWQVPTDAAYAWGGAFGLLTHDVAALGPGFNNRAVGGTGLQERQGGAHYRRNWERLLRMDPARRPRIVHVETWNELHEGSEIAETREHGRLYLNLTRRYAALWHARTRLPSPGPFAGAKSVTAALGAGGASRGVRLVDQADGHYTPAPEGVTPLRTEPSGRYLYFDVDNSFGYDVARALTVEVECRAAARAEMNLEYDSIDPRARFSGAYKPARAVTLTAANRWTTVRFALPDARCAGRQNGAADLRLVFAGEIQVRRITVRRK